MELQEFLKKYPWQDKYLSKRNPVEWYYEFELKLSKKELWPYISDTSQINRFMGLPEMKFQEKNGVLYGSSKYLGIITEWIEVPWTWIYGHHLIAIREYKTGFAHTVRAIFELVEIEKKKTKLYIYFGWIPRNFMYAMLLKMASSNIKANFAKALSLVEKAILEKSEKETIFSFPSEISSESKTRLQNIIQDLKKQNLSEAILDKLSEYILHGDDTELFRLRVVSLSKKWNFPERDIIRTFLYATKFGLLTMSWDIICPHCRGVRKEASSLWDVPVNGSCDVCEVDFETNQENSIEITFHIHPSIRNVPEVFFCSAEPAKKSHIKVQLNLEPGTGVTIPSELERGKYRLRVKSIEGVDYLNIDEGYLASKIIWKPEQTHKELQTKPKPEISIQNTLNKEASFTLESLDWEVDILRPSTLFNFQDYKNLFSTEQLPYDVHLNLGEQTILFTDIVGSTQMYLMEGDIPAFIKVKSHFKKIYDILNRYEGVIVKTIGDAVMSGFTKPANALQAAIELQKVFDKSVKESFVRLRVSINTGPCIAVNFNSGIDYFGSTINLGAKLQSFVNAGQVAFSEYFYNKPEVRQILEAQNIKVEELEEQIPSTTENLKVFRIRIS
ncbi:MAG: adenylate/guanylate cyclase domain-containing protein [Leptospiraceae bacterium]|nr:adenylate/guanylate cyclase domain-containing protein [Leptospiraceae bacterium]MCP5496353.1 adenylate/guanylate cyclase domain-containing protein [Leptospiraceae bacterium]